MIEKASFDVIIIGGSYAGMQAAMTLARALRSVLVIDSGEPCNRQTPHSHNFLTHDGESPAAISLGAMENLKLYTNISFYKDKAVYSMPYNNGFEVGTLSGKHFITRKLLFSSGVKDMMPAITGFAKCWGISILHCPYCHGYEVRNQPTGILGNGDMGFEFVKLISNWTDQLTLFTNGKSSLTDEQRYKLKSKKVNVVEHEVKEIVHQNGHIEALKFINDQSVEVKAIYTRLPFNQHCHIPVQLGCEFTNMELIKIDGFHLTSVPGVYAAGDCTSPLRSVASAVSGGMMAGASINKDLIEADF
ncbi:NAD(P)/FAD-dependent oxidoreductase [Mucilaginibacter agri]|uniref:FAD-dependent oxidoreductase n=1 Tax=Mucilaginibacter agri TaxID=2695265 RepID=A0A966DTV8_9SPHI|nr:NAD(P)/FAD-dependent oxidoreductase [Mucilaginibacter agri]NCD71065.1 FAD-dependent oxidoreductase [Mucilaginibacter agri]